MDTPGDAVALFGEAISANLERGDIPACLALIKNTRDDPEAVRLHSRALKVAAEAARNNPDSVTIPAASAELVEHLLVWEGSSAEPENYHIWFALDARNIAAMRHLLADGRADPDHLGYAIRTAVCTMDPEIVELIVEDPRVEALTFGEDICKTWDLFWHEGLPATRDRRMVAAAIEDGRAAAIAEALLRSGKVPPTDRYQNPLLSAALRGMAWLVEILLKDPRTRADVAITSLEFDAKEGAVAHRVKSGRYERALALLKRAV